MVSKNWKIALVGVSPSIATILNNKMVFSKKKKTVFSLKGCVFFSLPGILLLFNTIKYELFNTSM